MSHQYAGIDTGFIAEASRLHVVEIASCCKSENSDECVSVIRLGAKVVGWSVEHCYPKDRRKNSPETISYPIYQAGNGEREIEKIGYFDLDTKLFHSIGESPEFNLPTNLIYDRKARQAHPFEGWEG